MDHNQKNQQQLQVKASDEILKGQYATLAQVTHASEEFVLDFVNYMPPMGQLISRVIVSPSHFKRLVKAMQENLANYEDQFGVIQLQVVPDMKVNFNPTTEKNT